MKCPKCGTEWKNALTGGEIAAIVLLILFFSLLGLFSLFFLRNKKYCRTCHFNMKEYARNKFNPKEDKKPKASKKGK